MVREHFQRVLSLSASAMIAIFALYLDRAIEDFNSAIELNPNYADAYYNRGLAWLQLSEWEKAKIDLGTARFRGGDIVAAFQKIHGSIADFEQESDVTVPKDIATMLTQQ